MINTVGTTDVLNFESSQNLQVQFDSFENIRSTY